MGRDMVSLVCVAARFKLKLNKAKQFLVALDMFQGPISIASHDWWLEDGTTQV